MESAHINSHCCSLLAFCEKDLDKLILSILYCLHNLIFSIVSQELAKETQDLLIKHHLQESSKCMLEVKVPFTGCLCLNAHS